MMTSNSNIQYQTRKFNYSEVFCNKFKTFPLRFFFVTEIVLVECRVLFFKSGEDVIAKVRLAKGYEDIDKALDDNKITMRPQ